MSASEDLKFFANRLQGVMSLIPVIEKTETLENHNAELEAQIDKHKNVVKTLKTDLETKKKELVDWESKIKVLEFDVKAHQTALDALKHGLSTLKSKL